MKKFLNKLPMILVTIMVLVTLVPAVRTVIHNITSPSSSSSADGSQEAQTPDKAELSKLLHEDALILSPEGAISGVGQTTADEQYFLTWEEYAAYYGFPATDWHDAADAIEKVALHAADLYEAGDKDQAYQFAKATYWGYYETTGFERNTMTYISGARVSETELQFTTLRKAELVEKVPTPGCRERCRC